MSTQEIGQSMNELVKNTADVAQSTKELVSAQKLVQQSSQRVTASNVKLAESNMKLAESNERLADAYAQGLVLQDAQLMASDVVTAAMEQLSQEARGFTISLSQPTQRQRHRVPQFQHTVLEEASESSTSSDDETNAEEETEVENSLVLSQEL